ncbi:hypothetical protein PIB30_038275 [Stylosanthes scabra]|uniref:Uncharacterized protein n=1 Tax=Stylosanthes scabra TaxID=79078 RepID=A0ABU6YEP3_9FABA|nr:hypothetical protein [Stylosanthes scabra]
MRENNVHSSERFSCAYTETEVESPSCRNVPAQDDATRRRPSAREGSSAFNYNDESIPTRAGVSTGEYQSALDRIAQLEEDNRVLKTQLESCQLSLEREKKRSAAAEKQWQRLGTEVTEMCQETLDICLDQVSHLCLGVDFSAITLKSQWDLKGKRVYIPQESDVAEESPQADKVPPKQQPEDTTQISQPAAGDAAGVSGECPT